MMEDTSDTVMAGRYRLIRRLNDDAVVPLWLAVDLELDGCKVAVVMMPPAVVASQRAYHNVKAAAIESLKLLHTNIASTRALEDNAGQPFLVLDYTEGKSLAECLDDWGKLNETEAKAILEPLASAIDYAHAKDILHRDIRPSNVVVGLDGAPVLMGFCTSCEIREAVARTAGGLSAGPISHMSPEQLTGAPPSPAQDIYSFAAIAYECLAGHPPFHRGQIEYQIVNTPPPPLPEETPFTRAVMRALSKDPAQRPKSCAEILAGDMEPLVLPEVIAATPQKVSSRPRTATPSRSSRERPHRHEHHHHDRPSREEPKPAPPQGGASPAEKAKPGTGSGAKPAEKVAALKQALAAGAIIVILAALAFGIASCGGGGEREKPAPMAIAMATGEAIDLGNYGDFFGIPFGLAFQAPPVPGQDLGFGKVANVALGGGIFEVELAKPLFKVFPKVRVELADGLESRRIVRLNFERDGEGVDAAKARKVVEKIASLIGNKYKIDFGDLQVGIDDTYFSQKYSDTDIDIRISCAVSQDSTSIFFTVENRRVRALAQ